MSDDVIETVLAQGNDLLQEIRDDQIEMRKDLTNVRERLSKLEGLVQNIPGNWQIIVTIALSQFTLVAAVLTALRYAHPG